MINQEFILIGGMTLITFGIRYFPLAISGRMNLPPKLVGALQFVPPAVLTAIVVPAVLIPTGEDIFLSYSNARLVGAIAAIITAWFAKNLLSTIIAGMLVFFGWQWLLSAMN